MSRLRRLMRRMKTGRSRKILSYFLAFVPASLALFAAINSFSRRFGQETVENFVLKEKFELAQYHAVGYLYVHKKHGCPFLHIQTSDTHNFFASTFRTTCTDNSGSTHVLEHLSLHGSERFPIRSVFTELIKNSLATFLNAFTSVEWTAYPFSSTNHKDFHNVMDVYLDAIFHPRLDPLDFQSECHHLEFEEPENMSSPLRHSGVVYNEMNGEMSNPESRFESLIRRHLYPESLFGFEYGGNPPDIANLTVQGIKNQHDRYYHPSNALFFHYGSFDKIEIMKKVNDIIEPFDNKVITIPDELIDQPKWKEPHFVEEEGPADDDLTHVRASINWMVGDLRNSTDVTDIGFLSSLLTFSSVSPLFQGLIKTGVGSKFFNTGYMPVVRSPYFSIGLEGVNGTDVHLNETVLNLLEQIFEKGFDPLHVKSVLHMYEIGQLSVSASEGMDLWNGLVSCWIHDVNPFDLLDRETEITRIKETLKKQPKYYELLMKEKLIDNTHRLDLIMRGVEGFQEKGAKEIKNELESKKVKMTQQEKQEIVNTAKAIREAVDAPKPLEKLPRIEIDDINKTSPIVNYEIKDNIWHFEQPTNGLVYVRVKCELPINKSNIEDMPLLNAVFTSLGASNLNEDEFAQQENLFTGGISSSLYVAPSIDDPNQLKASFVISASSLVDDVEKMIQLIHDLLFSPHLNNEDRIRIILQMTDSNFATSIASSGHSFAILYSASSLSPGSALSEMWNGVTYFKRVHKFVEENNMTKVSRILESAYKEILMESNFSASIHCESSNMKKTESFLNKLVHDLNEESKKNRLNSKEVGLTNSVLDFMNQQKNNSKAVLSIDSSTFFCAVTMKGPTYSDHNGLKRYVASKLIKSEYLHDMIREKLGAYGVMQQCDLYNGVTGFVSYRDTNPTQVLLSYKDAVDIAASKTIIGEGKKPVSEEMINRTILQIFSDIDTPNSPNSRGIEMFLKGITNEINAKIRKTILDMKVDDVVSEALVMKNLNWTSAIVGNSATLTKQDGYTVIKVA